MGLSFFRPEYLWGALILLLPLALHLFSRRRAPRIEFPSLRFLHATAVRTSQRRNLQRVLLLLARLLIAGLIVALFAKPFDRSNLLDVIRDPSLSVLWWIDPTLSMDYRESGVSRLQRGHDLLDSLRKSIAPTAEVFEYREAQREFVAEAGNDDASSASSVRCGPARADQVLRAAGSRVRRLGRRSLLVVVSDFQDDGPQGALSAMSTWLADGSPPVSTVCVSVSPRQPWNARLSGATPSMENEGILTAKVRAWGRDLHETELVAVMDGTRVGARSVSAAKDAETTVRVDLAQTRTSTRHAGYAELRVDDPFVWDNTDYFVAGQRTARRVLIVGDQRRCTPILAAFGALGANAWSPVLCREPAAVSPTDLDSADIIVLNGVDACESALRPLTRGRSLSPKAIVFALSTDSTSRGSCLAQEVFAHLGGNRDARSVVSTIPRALSLPDTVSALWRGFPSLRDREVAVRGFYSRIPGRPLLVMESGEPFAAISRDSTGHAWIVLASELGICESNNLCETGFFVPFLDRLSRHALSAVRTATWRVVAGTAFPNPCAGTRRSATLLTSEGRVVAEWGSGPLVQIDKPGLYLVKPEGEADYWIAAGVDSTESRCVYRMPNVPASIQSTVRCMRDDEFTRFISAGGSLGMVQGFWALILLLLLAEVLLWVEAFKNVPHRNKSTG